MNLDVALCLPQEAESVAVTRRVIIDALATLGVTPECLDDIRLALSEACTNVIDHAAPGDEYEVRLQVDAARCALSVHNTGDGFDASSLVGVMPDAASARGRGVAIMRALMDDVEFRSEPQAGTIVHLVKSLEVVPASPLGRLRARGPTPDAGA